MNKQRITIYEIKYRTRDTQPYFFNRKTMRFFGQTLKDFSVIKLSENRYRISAPMRGYDGKYLGQTVRIFNAVTNRLEFETQNAEVAL